MRAFRISIAITISLILYFLLFDEYFVIYITTTPSVHMILLLIFSYFLYVLISLVTVKNYHVSTTAPSILYLVFLIIMFFSKDNYNANATIFNLDVSKIAYNINHLEGIIVTIFNILICIPLGYMFRRTDILIKFILPLGLFLLVEYIQYLYQIGIFDINDVFLNTIGFYIGVFILPICYRQFKKKR